MGQKIQSRTIDGKLKHRVITFDDDTAAITDRGEWYAKRETAERHLAGEPVEPPTTPEQEQLALLSNGPADPTGELGAIPPDTEPAPRV
jgi:hypothetical protein